MSDKRTTTSNWVYRAVLGLMLVGAGRYVLLLHEQMLPILNGSNGYKYWVTIGVMATNALPLIAANLAMLLRSGAVVWLLALQFLDSIVGFGISMFSQLDIGLLAIIGIALAIVLITIALLFAYLIKHGEIRKP